MIKAGTGISNDQDAFEAGKQAALQAKEEMKGINPQLILVSASSPYDQEKVLSGIDSVFPDIPLAGGSPGGGIITNKEIEDNGVAITGLNFEKTKFAIACQEDLSQDAFQAGINLAQKLKQECQEAPKLIILFPDRIDKNGNFMPIDSLLKGLKQELGEESSIIGGVTFNENFFKGKLVSGFQYFNKTVNQDSVVAVGFSGDFSFGISMGHGWEPIGLEMEVTKAKPGFIQEIDGNPAIQVYEKYLQKTKEELMDPKFWTGEGLFYPFGIILKNPKRTIVRQTGGVGITSNGELIVPEFYSGEGTMIRLMQVLPEKMPQVAEKIAKDALSELRETPDVSFIFSCCIRKLLTAPDHKKEIYSIKKIIGENIPLFGYWSGGEICSKSQEKEWLAHNETITLALMSE